MTSQKLADDVLAKMLSADGFSAWLGISVHDFGPGRVTCKMKIRKEMLNGFGTCHGGIAYSLADSALAFASNSHGRISVALDTSMSYPTAVLEGDELTAVARELRCTDKVGFYDVEVKNQNAVVVAIFRGTVYRTQKKFFPEAV
ncbi:MAG: hydroxyphenylacetyl-CoA thioesterase PaaI [Deltaproteobacteria bacterium]|nr:hydroxyphenylacetyl-CoA thioesterase PaaI [Deltaproteobacteria bacterium]